MTDFLPREVREGLDQARRAARRPARRLRVEVGGESFAVLRYWEEGFALDATLAPRLRGLVDLYDGPSHEGRFLIVASAEEEGERRYEFKRRTPPHPTAPRDSARDEAELLPRLPRD